jgi:hypothetical protein
MGRRRIFISHSNADPDSGPYIDAIETALKADGFDVLIDRKRLRPGENWRDEIYTWLGLCHGAVILVSEAAIRPASIWVPREASILLWRRALDSKFPVVPACLRNVTPEDLTCGVFQDMQLRELETAPAGTPEDLAAALRTRFAFLAAPKTPLEILASRIAEALVTATDLAIEEALEMLSIDLGPCAPTNDSRRTLALALLQTPLRRALWALEVLAECMDSAKVDQIFAMIAPSWVDLCAARWLAECGACATDKPAVMLNAETLLCAQHYVYRASCRPPKTRWRIVNSTGIHGERAAQEIAAEIEQNLMSEYRFAEEPGMPPPRTRLAALLRECQRDGRPVFATLRFSAAVAASLPELQRLLPEVTFVLLSGQEFPSPSLVESRRIRLVEPRLGRGVEAQALADYDYVQTAIRAGYPAPERS